MRHILLLMVAVLALAACNRQMNISWNSSYSSSSEWSANGKRTLTRTKNGLMRKIETTTDVEFANGAITKYPKDALLKLQESEGPRQLQAELRENSGNLELWINDNATFRRGSSEDEAWLQTFLSEITGK